MMKYQQISSTFIPKKTLDAGSDTPENDNYNSSNEKLILQIKEYDDKMKELEKQLKLKDSEIHSSGELIASLEKTINELRNAQGPVNTAEADDLITKLRNIEEENLELKKEIAIQNEHTQLLYVLIIILSII